MEGEGEFITVEDAYQLVTSVRDINTAGTFKNWRLQWDVPVVHVVRRADLERALNESRTREQSNKSRGRK